MCILQGGPPGDMESREHARLSQVQSCCSSNPTSIRWERTLNFCTNVTCFKSSKEILVVVFVVVNAPLPWHNVLYNAHIPWHNILYNASLPGTIFYIMPLFLGIMFYIMPLFLGTIFYIMSLFLGILFCMMPLFLGIMLYICPSSLA